MLCYSQLPTPTDRLRAPASPESSRPPPLSTSLGPACSVTPLPPPQAERGETSRSIKPREPSYRWHLRFSRRFYETPRARHALLTSCFPSKPVTPICLMVCIVSFLLKKAFLQLTLKRRSVLLRPLVHSKQITTNSTKSRLGSHPFDIPAPQAAPGERTLHHFGEGLKHGLCCLSKLRRCFYEIHCHF